MASLVAITLVAVMTTAGAFAQKPAADDNRKEWMSELRNYKHAFFKKDLNLSREQEAAFFKAYDEMDDEIIRIGEETRSLERKINSDDNASETEIESAARAMFEQKKKEADVELRYFDEFSKILTKRQLLKLKETERRFNRALLKHSTTKRGEKKGAKD